MSLDPLGAFKSEVFRPIASIVLPGSLAIGMYAILLGNAVEEVHTLFATQPLVYFSVFFGAATTVGMLLENIGSSIERGVDTCMEREYLHGAEPIWGAYLAASSQDLNARKYLGTLVTRLKFLNSMIPAVLLFSVGLMVLNFQLDRWSWWWIVCIEVGLLTLVSWLFKSSVELSEAAVYSRFRLLAPGHGIQLDENAHTVSRFRHFAYSLAELRTSRVEEMNFVKLNWPALLVECIRFTLPMTKKVTEATKATNDLGSLHAAGSMAVGSTEKGPVEKVLGSASV